MIASILLFVCEIIFGLLIIDFFDPEKKLNLFERISFSAFSGFVISNFIILIFSLLLGSIFTGIYIFCLFFLAFLLLKFKLLASFFKKFEKQDLFSKKNIWILALFAILFAYFLFELTIFFYSKDMTYLSALIGWGDTALHISLIERFANAFPFNLDHPYMGGARLTYPFMIDFMSGVFRALGADIIFAYRLPLIFSGIMGMILAFIFCYKTLKSKAFAIIALLFIFWGSGTGIFMLFDDLKNSFTASGIIGVFKFVENPPHEYTHLDDRTGGKDVEKNTKDDLVWIVPVISFFSHQRGFSLGFGVFCLVLLGIYFYRNSRFFWRYGLIAGLMPFCHGHAFIALFLLCSILFWFNLKDWKKWLLFALATLIISLPQIIFFKSDSNILANMFRPWFGWMTCEHNYSWLNCDSNENKSAFVFWLKNFGVVFIGWLAVLFVFIGFKKFFKKHGFKSSFISASILLFTFPNIFLIQPWPFDNNKVIFYWWLIAVIFCLIPLLKILWEKRNIYAKIIVILAIFFGTGAGVFDFTSKFFWTKKTGSYGYSDYSKENVKMGDWIKANTPNNSLFLTSISIDPVPVFLAGRKAYLGFEGWLWSEGLDYMKNRVKAQKILKGDFKLACKEGISYILFNSSLKESYSGLNEEYIYNNSRIVYSQSKLKENDILKIDCEKI